MPTGLVSLGYTGAGWLDWGDGFKKLMMPGCNIQFETTPMVSNAVWQFARAVHAVRRTRSAYINDVPRVELNVTFDPERAMFLRLLRFLAETRNSKMQFKYTDHDSGIAWTFPEIYAASFGFNVTEHSILSVSMGFFVMTDSISYQWDDRKLNARGHDTEAPIRKPVGYYRWKIQDGDFRDVPDVTEFSFEFRQEIKPQYECRGKDSDEAPVARNLLFGLPSISFDYTQTMYRKGGSDYGDTLTRMRRQDELLETRVHFLLHDAGRGRYDEAFVLSGVKEVSSVPTQVGGFKTVRRECAVYGTLEVD